MTVKDKGGRPRHGTEVKNAPLNMRTSPELRERIERAADQWGHSLSSEVARRLISSFHYEDAMQGAFISAFAQLMASMIRAIEEKTGKGWHDDYDTYRAVQAGANQLLAWHRPARPAIPDADAMFERVKQAREARDAASEALDNFRAGFGIMSIKGTELPAIAAPAPTPTGGMFGAPLPPRSNPTLRGRMTDDERAEELALLDTLRDAGDEYAAAHDALMAVFTPLLEASASAEAMGAETAAQLFAELGPKQKA